MHTIGTMVLKSNEKSNYRYESQEKLLREYTEKQTIVLKENFDYEEFNLNDPYHTKAVGGRIICKHCKKTYQWSDWGRGQTYSLGKASKHIRDNHNIRGFNQFMFRDTIDIAEVFGEV